MDIKNPPGRRGGQHRRLLAATPAGDNKAQSRTDHCELTDIFPKWARDIFCPEG
jgi:hypothetical protein